VIINLVVNAMEDVVEPTLFIRTWADSEWRTREITDNGPGFTHQARKHLFELFFTTKPVGKGTERAVHDPASANSLHQ
jgi:two-component system, NtrC family, sensor kinase